MRWRRVLMWVLTSLLVLVGLPIGLLIVTLMEYQDYSSADPRVWITLPSEVRRLNLPELCTPPRYSRSYQDCGGLCGWSIDIKFGSRALNREAARVLAEQARIATRASAASVWETDPRQPDCPGWWLDLSFDDRIPLEEAVP